MNTTLSLENILHMLSGLSLSNRQWLAEHLVEPEEQERAKQRKSDEEWLRELHAFHYEGEKVIHFSQLCKLNSGKLY